MTSEASNVIAFPNVPYAFECPRCEHFPMVKARNQKDVYLCNAAKCHSIFILVEDLFGGIRFMQDRGKKGVADFSATAFERIPGKVRSRGKKVFS